jgi:hypothetical protein
VVVRLRDEILQPAVEEVAQRPSRV